MSNKRLWLIMSNKRLWLIRVIVIVGVTAVVAVVKQFSPIAAAATGGILVGGAIAYLLPMYGAQWQKSLWWVAVAVALFWSIFLAITGSMRFWFWVIFIACIAISITVGHVFLAMRRKK
jgi:predicted membrane protein